MINVINLSQELQSFIFELTSTPILNDRYIAHFMQTGALNGQVNFVSLKDNRSANAEWVVYLENLQVCAKLKYNHNLVFLRSAAKDFRDRIVSIPVF